MQIWVFSIPIWDVSDRLWTQFGGFGKIKKGDRNRPPLCSSILSSLRRKPEVVDRVLQVGAGVSLISQIVQVMACDPIDSELDDQFLNLGFCLFIGFHFLFLQFFTKNTITITFRTTLVTSRIISIIFMLLSNIDIDKGKLMNYFNPEGEGGFPPPPFLYSSSLLIKSISDLIKFRIAVAMIKVLRVLSWSPFFFCLAICFTPFRKRCSP